MMLSTERTKLFAGRACRTKRTTRAGRVTVRITKMIPQEMIAHEPSARLLEVLLDGGNVLPGNGGFVHVWVEIEHLLEVLEGGIELGDAAGVDGLGHEGESKGVVGEGVFGIVGERLLAIGDGGIEIGGLALAFAHAVPGHVVVVVPDVAFGDALLAAHADQRAEHVVIQLTGELTVEIAELEVFVIDRAGFGELTAEAQAIGQPEMRLGGLRVDPDGFPSRISGWPIAVSYTHL